MAKRTRTPATRGNSPVIREAILASPEASADEVTAALADQGITLSRSVVQYHRRRQGRGDLPRGRGGRGKGKGTGTELAPVRHSPVEVVEEDSGTVPMAEYRRLVHNQRVWAQALVLLATALG